MLRTCRRFVIEHYFTTLLGTDILWIGLHSGVVWAVPRYRSGLAVHDCPSGKPQLPEYHNARWKGFGWKHGYQWDDFCEFMCFCFVDGHK